VKHRAHLKESQLPEFLYWLDQYHGRDYIRLAMKLQIITFLRPGELRMGLWEEIDWKNALWRIPAERMKMKRAHVVPLTTQALDILAKLEEITGNNELMFPGIRATHKPISDVTLTKVLRTMGYTGDMVVPHGFRHTASTILNEHRFDHDVIERQLAHVEKNKIRGIYNHAEYLDERRKMMQWYADHLDTLKASYTLA
jgi:integrase